jgi:hypothetical protein
VLWSSSDGTSPMVRDCQQKLREGQFQIRSELTSVKLGQSDARSRPATGFCVRLAPEREPVALGIWIGVALARALPPFPAAIGCHPWGFPISIGCRSALDGAA